MSNKLLDIKDLQVIYKSKNTNVKAINGINIELKKGETLGLVGETGAGKTTTALSIMNLLPERTGKITNGKIEYKGKNILDMKYEVLRNIRGNKIAMIFQDPMTSLNPILTVGKQIGEVLRMHTSMKEDEIDRRVCEVLELVGIPKERRHEYPHQFSGGMKQRVVIAMALTCEPELLIADEPTTALDVTIQAQVLDLMKNLKKKLGTAMILITHDLGVVAETCDRIAIMYAGEIVETGTLRDIFKGDKHHPYTEGLFGSIPNLKEKTNRLKPIDGLVPDPTNLPKGCYFYPRCPKKKEICKKEHPEDFKKDTHSIKCHLFKIRR